MKYKVALLILFLSILTFAQNESKEKDVFNVARSGTVEEIKVIESKTPGSINSVNASGFTPLILACYRGNLPVAEYLMTQVNNINYVSPSGTALAAVIVKGDKNLAQKLLENKADPNLADSNGTTPLIFAVQFQNKDIVKMLLEFKADKSIADKNGKTPFEHAVFSQNKEIIELLKN